MKFREIFALVLLVTAGTVVSAQERRSGMEGEYECITVLTPEQEAYMNAISNNGRRVGGASANAGKIINIPVQHHIFRRSDGSGGLALTEIDPIIELLNEAYEDTKLSFYSCSDPIEYNDDTYFSLRTDMEEAMCADTEVPDVLNIYYVDEVLYAGINMCGYTYFPGGKDRLIIDEECARNGSTIVHEMGHYFSLSHTHGDMPPGAGTDELADGSNCRSSGDQICDTPADPGLNYFTVSGSCNYTGGERDALGTAYVPLTDNHMSYSRRDCRKNFTDDQLKAIRFSALNHRKNLGCPCATPQNAETFVTATSATLSWDEVPGAMGYELKGRMGTSGPFRSLRTQNNLKLVKRLRPMTTYQWKVRTKCTNGGVSKFTTLQQFTTLSERVAKPHEVPLRPVVLYPNPVINELGLETACPTSGKMKIEIFDLYGHKKMDWKSRCEPGLNDLRLPVDDLPTGGYVLSIQQNERVQQARFEIMR